MGRLRFKILSLKIHIVMRTIIRLQIKTLSVDTWNYRALRWFRGGLGPLGYDLIPIA
jgi:hypothetical protein